jgi:hypothetical protein
MTRIAVVAASIGLLGAAGANSAEAKSFGGIVPDLPNAHVAVHRPLAHIANLPYGGGPVLHSNRTHVIFWQPSGSGLTFDAGYESLIQSFLANVAADSRRPTNVYGLTGQYTDRSGPAAYDSGYVGAVVATDQLPPNGCIEPPGIGPGWTVCLTDSQLQTEIERVVRTDRLATGSDDVYFLVTPKGLGSCTDSGSTSCALGGAVNGYCAYHAVTNDGLVLYAVIPYNAVPGHCQSDNPRPNSNTADPALSSISHEHSEMVTDPAADAWIDNSGNEDGDLCRTNFGPAIGGSGAGAWNEVIHGGHYFLQEEWSNADGGCQPRAKPDAVSFKAAPGRGRRWPIAFTGHGSAPHGAIVAYRWFFGDGRGASGRAVSHRYRRAGRFRVILRITDSWGNWGFYAGTVTVGSSAGRPPRVAKSG